jgi:PHP domain
MFLADFHVHSTFSDGRLTIPQVVDFYGTLGFGAVAITDHLCERHTLLGMASAQLGCSLTDATFPLYLEILRSEAERAMQQYKMVVLTGLELTKNSVLNHRSAHVLALGVTESLSADGDLVDILKRVRSTGALTIAAHPVWTRKVEKQTYHLWDRREELEPYFDAWEVASGPYIFSEVADSSLPKIASSDLHARPQMRSWKTILNCEREPQAILEAIRSQKVDFHYYAWE